ncbi:MAG: hypothetical protein AAF108_04760 [Planctomycetota bacterium]
MIMSLASIGVAGGIAYFWLSRGFFSSLIHLICTLIAGAVAFAVWEPAAHAILSAIGPERGFKGFIGDSAWAIALAFPFALSLVLLRVLADLALPKNVKVTDIVNAVGGLGCGLGSGVISAGVLVIAVSYMRLPAEVLGYQPLKFEGQGHLTDQQSLLVPVDRMVAGFYRGLSTTSLKTQEPFARHYPRFALTAGAQRMSYESESKKNPHRNTIAPGDVRIIESYRLESQGSQRDTFGDTFRGKEFGFEPHTDLEGNPREAETELIGYRVEFQSGANEKFAQVVVKAPQVWLTVENPDSGERDVVFPYAAISAERVREQARFVFDGPGTVLTSQGGASTVPMTFEFPLEPGFEPISLTVRNLRLPVDSLPEPRVFAVITDRDALISSGAIAGQDQGKVEEELAKLEADEAASVGRSEGVNGPGQFPENVTVGTRMPARVSLTSGRTRGVEIDDDNRVVNGSGRFSPDETKRAPSRELVVDSFATISGTNLVMIDVAGDPSQNKQSLLGRSVQTAQRVLPPQLIDTNGQRYDCIGFVYREGTQGEAEIRYTPSRPLRGLSEAPALSSARDDQILFLIFRASIGAEIQSLVIGNKVIVEYDPSFTINRGRRR